LRCKVLPSVARFNRQFHTEAMQSPSYPPVREGNWAFLRVNWTESITDDRK
jgi:hypothetical protein